MKTILVFDDILFELQRNGYLVLSDGQPCEHPGCHLRVSHPCEICGRICAQGTVIIRYKFYSTL